MSEAAVRMVSKNKRALFEYFIEERFEAGIVLTGSEVKSVRLGKANIEDSHAAFSGNEIIIYNMHIAEYEKAHQFNHNTRRPRKLLLHKGEIRKIIGKIKLRGYTLVGLSLYFNKDNRAKLEIGIAKGKKLYDKRDSIKAKEWAREKDRITKTMTR